MSRIKFSRKNLKIIVIPVGLLVISLISGVLFSIYWYNQQLSPLDKEKRYQYVSIHIEDGLSFEQITKKLFSEKIIKNNIAMNIYLKLNNKENKLKAGFYQLSSSDTVPAIVNQLVEGKISEKMITFLPGATITQNEKVFKESGFSELEINQAFNKDYAHKLFIDKPAGSNIEGYIYGETYRYLVNDSIEIILERAFDEFYNKIKENNIQDGLKQQGLNLYQGIVIASIVEKEVIGEQDRRQVAQIFLKRYKEDMELGSDITAYYGADLLGLERKVSVDSPYNTRINKGLPAGPVSSPSIESLKAVAFPAEGNYLYFLSGDDDKTYYANEINEHESNIKNHCKIKCNLE